jgi:uncharacterized coiled-coil protein SlyX
MAAPATPTTESRLTEIEQRLAELRSGLTGELQQFKDALAARTAERDALRVKFDALVGEIDSVLEKHAPHDESPAPAEPTRTATLVPPSA